MRTDDDRAVQNARHRARRAGLRLAKRADTFTLRDGHGNTIAAGDLTAVSVHIRDRRYAPRPGSGWGQLIDDYLCSLAAAGQRPATIRLRADLLRRFARSIGHPPAQVTGELLVEWFGSQRWSTETRRSYRAAVRGLFAWAYRTKRVADYLSDDLPKVREQHGAPRPVPDHVWRAALLAADPRTTVMLRLAAEAGLRRVEVAAVHTRDLLDGIGGAQLLVHGKGGKQRVVPLGDSLAAAIRHGAAGHTAGAPAHGWLFPNGRGGHLRPYHVGDLVGRVLADGYTMHGLRHRFASRAYRGSRNLRAVQMLLGHESVATTQRYTAVDDAEIRAAMLAAIGD